MNPQEALQKAVDIVGSQSRLARELGVKQAHIHYWLTQASVVPAEHCPTIEHIVKHEVRCEDLNPRVDWWVLRHEPQLTKGRALVDVDLSVRG